MVKIVEFKRLSFLSQPVAGGPKALIEQGKGSRYELVRDIETAGVPDGFVKITIKPTPDDKLTWFAEKEAVQQLDVEKTSPALPADSKLSIIEFTNPDGSFLKQSPTILSPAREGNDNVIFQGKGTRCEVHFTPEERDGHREMRIPIKPGGKETWWVFEDHFVTVK